MSTPEDAAAEFDPLSRDATHSTYTEGDDEVHDDNPPPGPRTVQERGVPDEVNPTRASSTSTSASTKATVKSTSTT